MIKVDNKFALSKVSENSYCHYIIIYIVITIKIRFYKIYLYDVDIIKT